jgi:DNA-binding beta-propeller fold protein YncE
VIDLDFRRVAVFVGMMGLAACDSGDLVNMTEEAQLDRVAVVANRGDRTLTLIPFADSVGMRSVPLGSEGEAAGVAVRGDRGVVPMGAPGVALVDLRTGTLQRMVRLPEGAAARGAAFLHDTLVAVAAPGAGGVFLINPFRVTAPRAVATGGNPEVVQEWGGRLFVLSPTSGNGRLVILDSTLVPAVVELGAPNPRAVVVRGALAYVLNAGDPGQGTGSVSVVDIPARREIGRIEGFGESPEAMALSPRGELYVAVPTRGVLVYDLTGVFVRGLSSPIASSSTAPASRVAMDPAGFMYTLHRGGCTGPGLLVRLDPSGAPASSARTGICPIGVEFTSLPRR